MQDDSPDGATTVLANAERFDSLLPPVHHVVVPAVRGRAHTVDVECGRSYAESDDGDFFDEQLGTEITDLNDGDDSYSSLDEDMPIEPPMIPSMDTTASRRRHSDTFFPRHRSLRMSLSQESRHRRQRQKLVTSRCMRGFIALCVYGVLVIDGWSSTLLRTVPPEPNTIGNGLLKQPTATSENSTAAVRRAQLKTLNPKAKLPKFHHGQRRFFSTMPPGLNASAAAKWHKVPPAPPHVYHKKQRPILNHASSYRLHQEPLLFGREQKTSFFDESGDTGNSEEHGVAWTTSLIWLSLLVLLVDTSYREWQHHRWHRQFLTTVSSGAPTLSDMQRRQRRSLHHRRSPSPVPRSSPNRRPHHYYQPPPQRPRFDSF